MVSHRFSQQNPWNFDVPNRGFPVDLPIYHTMRGHVSHLALCLLQIRLPRAGADVSRSCLAHPRHFGADDAGDGLGSFGAGVSEARGGGGNNRFFLDCNFW